MPEMQDCKPSCCDTTQKKIEVKVDYHPIYDASCDCEHAASYVPKDGIVIERGDVVFFTGVEKTLQVNGKDAKFAEVDKASTLLSGGVAGVALWKIDNSNNDTGATQFLTHGRLFSRSINLNGATIPAMKAAGFDIAHVYN